MLVVKCDMKYGEMEVVLLRSTEIKLSGLRSGLTAEDDDGKRLADVDGVHDQREA